MTALAAIVTALQAAIVHIFDFCEAHALPLSALAATIVTAAAVLLWPSRLLLAPSCFTLGVLVGCLISRARDACRRDQIGDLRRQLADTKAAAVPSPAETVAFSMPTADADITAPIRTIKKEAAP